MALFFLAGGTDPEEFKLVGEDAITGALLDLGRHPGDRTDLRVENGLAPGADQVGMGVGLSAVVTVAAVGEAELQDLADFLQQVHRFVDCRQAGCGKVDLHLGMNLLNARMLFATEKGLEDGNPLRCNPEFTLAELAEDFIQAFLRVFHISTLNVGPMLLKMNIIK